jgi:hypothetical protein
MVSARLLVAASLLVATLALAAPAATAQNVVCVEGGSLGCSTSPGMLVQVHAAGETVSVRDPCYTASC